MNFPIKVPFLDPHGFFVDHQGRLADRPAALASPDSAVDLRAAFSVLQYGAIIPPLSPYRDISRLLPGYEYRSVREFQPRPLEPVQSGSSASLEQQVEVLLETLDQILLDQTREITKPVVLFSGGVDSSLIAARLKHLGFDQTLLVNYAFGPLDPESQLAEKIAATLGLRMLRVEANPDLCACLEDPGAVFPQPFGDASAVPTWDLSRAVLEILGSNPAVIFDGTGADGAFGLPVQVRRWQKVFGLPYPLRQAGSLAYREVLWKAASRLEYPARVLHRSLLPPFSAVLARAALSGMLYTQPEMYDFDRAYRHWVSGWSGDDLVANCVAGDLALVCANIFAQKDLPILEAAGHTVRLPFLEEKMLSLALLISSAGSQTEKKAAVKAALARHLPPEWVYRPKSGFSDPRGQVFHQPRFLEYLAAAAEPSGPLAPILNRANIQRLIGHLARGKNLPFQTSLCLWSIVFTDRWYRTVIPAARLNRDGSNE